MASAAKALVRDHIERRRSERTQVAVEFAHPAPQFWAIGRQRYEPSPTRDTVPNHVLQA